MLVRGQALALQIVAGVAEGRVPATSCGCGRSRRGGKRVGQSIGASVGCEGSRHFRSAMARAGRKSLTAQPSPVLLLLPIGSGAEEVCGGEQLSSSRPCWLGSISAKIDSTELISVCEIAAMAISQRLETAA